MTTASAATSDHSPRESHVWVRTGLCLVVAAAAYAPLLVEHARNLWSRPHYQFYPFALAAFAAIAYLRIRDAEPRVEPRRSAGLAATAFGATAIALLGIATFAYSPWLAAISVLALVAAGIARIQQGYEAPGLWGTWAILLLLVPPPLNRDQLLIASLQRLSSQVSSWWLDLFGVLHLMEGNTLALADKQLFVDEACSGIISVMSLVACAVIYGVWMRRPALHVVALAAAGVAWAVFTNIVRIVIIAVAYEWYGLDWTTGAVHEGLSLAVFTLAFLGLASTDRLLSPWLAPVRVPWLMTTGAPLRFGKWIAAVWDACFPQASDPYAPATAGEAVGDDPPAFEPRHAAEVLGNSLWRGGRAWAFAAGLGALAAVQVYYWQRGQADAEAGASAVDRIPQALALGQDALPTQLAGFEQTGFELETREESHVFGAYSLVYRYQDSAGRAVVLSCSFPFHEAWHDLTVCYQGVGWTAEFQRPLEADAELAERSMEAGFQQSSQRVAYLVYRYFDANGNWVKPPSQDVISEALRSVGRRELLDRFRQRYQVQALIVTGEPLDGAGRTAVQRLLAEASEAFRKAICESPPSQAGTPPSAANGEEEAAPVE